MKLVDALRNDVISWDDLNAYEEQLKSFKFDNHIVVREAHELKGYSGKAYAIEVLTDDYSPLDSFSWYEWQEVNSKEKLKKFIN